MKIKIKFDITRLSLFILPILLLTFILGIVLGATYVSTELYGNTTLFTYASPVNNTVYYNKSLDTALFINFTTNISWSQCKFMWNMNGTYFSLTSTNNKTWSNITSYGFFDNYAGQWQNLTFKCYNETGTANITFTNSSMFRFNIYSSTSYSIQDLTALVNNTAYSNHPVINITLNHSVTQCNLVINQTTLAMKNTTVHNDSDIQLETKEYWTNSTNLAQIVPDSVFGAKHNITYYCTDTYGNKTWFNTSVGGIKLYKIDTTKPAFPVSPTWSEIRNSSTERGNYIELYFNVSDTNPSKCWAGLMYEDGTILNTSILPSYVTTMSSANCSINITPSAFTKDGFVNITGFAMDGVGRVNYTDTNQSYIVYRLKTGWNLITGYENKTFQQIANEFENVSYVSGWDNVNKTFSTLTVGSSTNGGLLSNASSKYGYGAVYVYVSENIVTIRRHYPVVNGWTNATLYPNRTATETPWNLVAVTKQIINLNASMMKNVCYNYSNDVINQTIIFTTNNTQNSSLYGKVLVFVSITNYTHTIPANNYTVNASGGGVTIVDTNYGFEFGIAYNVTYSWTKDYSYGNCANVTWVSWWDTQNNRFCSFYRNRLSTGCTGIKSTTMNMTRGDALWIAVQNGINITLSRSEW